MGTRPSGWDESTSSEVQREETIFSPLPFYPIRLCCRETGRLWGEGRPGFSAGVTATQVTRAAQTNVHNLSTGPGPGSEAQVWIQIRLQPPGGSYSVELSSDGKEDELQRGKSQGLPPGCLVMLPMGIQMQVNSTRLSHMRLHWGMTKGEHA